jgi:hypothetical protein
LARRGDLFPKIKSSAAILRSCGENRVRFLTHNGVSIGSGSKKSPTGAPKLVLILSGEKSGVRPVLWQSSNCLQTVLLPVRFI